MPLTNSNRISLSLNAAAIFVPEILCCVDCGLESGEREKTKAFVCLCGTVCTAPGAYPEPPVAARCSAF